MQDTDESQTQQPKRRGRPPKNQTSQMSPQPVKRRGRPPKKNPADEETQTRELFVSVPEETHTAPEPQPDSESAAARFAEAASGIRKAGRGRFKNFKRQDGPKWRDITEQAQSESSSDSDTADGEVFVPSGDDFAFSGESRENSRSFEQPDSLSENADDSRGGDSDEDSPVPSAYSTTDDDLLQDNYRNSWRDDSADAAETSQSSESGESDDERPWPDGAENADSQRQQNQRDFRNNRRNEFQQNRQFGDRQNNKWRNNKKGAFDNNRKQQNQQQRQNDNRQNQNQNRQNRQQNNRQNQQQQNKPNNQNNRQQNRQNKPKTDFGGINPAKLLDWDVLKSEQSIADYLAQAYFGKTPAEQTPAENLERALQSSENADTTDINADQTVSADFANEAPAAETGEQSGENSAAEEQLKNGEQAQTHSAESAPAAAETADEPEIQNVKPDGELSYWDMLERSNAQMLDDSGAEKNESAAQARESSESAQPQGEPAAAATAETAQPDSGAAADKNFAPDYAFDVPECGRLSALENFDEICKKTPKEISEALDALAIGHSAGLNKNSLVFDFYAYALSQRKLVKVSGYLDVFENSQGGAVVFSEDDYRLLKYSVYVPQLFIEKYALKRGHKLEVLAALPDGGECPFAVKICTVMGGDPDAVKNVVAFNDLVPYYPTRRIIMESQTQPQKANISMRAVDLLAPVGLGQRGLIVAPPRTGKTVLMQSMAHSILENVPTAHLIILLVDERPEEVTDFRMDVPEAEIFASSNDEDLNTHIRISDLAIERAKHLVETGKDVVLLMDSLTRLARAHNAAKSGGGRTMSGGLDIRALERPRQMFSAARATEEGGSLTIIASALIETGSRMDELIFQEFKGTGNMEMVLDRKIAEMRIWPAINISASGTRREELLLSEDELEAAGFLRRAMAGAKPEVVAETLVSRMKQSKTNAEFIQMIL